MADSSATANQYLLITLPAADQGRLSGLIEVLRSLDYKVAVSHIDPDSVSPVLRDQVQGMLDAAR